MTDVRLTALNPEDSQAYPVACNTSGELKLEKQATFDGNLDGDLTVSGTSTLEGGVIVTGGYGNGIISGIQKGNGNLSIVNEFQSVINVSDANNNLGFYLNGSSSAKVSAINREKRLSLSITASTKDATEAGTRPDQGIMGMYSATSLEAGKTAENISCFFATSGSNTAEALVKNQYAFYANNSLKTAFNVYGYYTNLFKTHNQGGQTFAFYSAGDAPSYFKGNIDCDGSINGAFSLRMQTDDPAAYTTTYSTDEEGNEVINTVYEGTTEDLLSIITDLRARVTALEAFRDTLKTGAVTP